jgi:methionyl-tRNA formyltransferase
MRIIFMGSPGFAVPCLESIHRDHEIAAVVTQPDRPSGRGRSPRPSAVNERAQALDLNILTPSTLKDAAIQSELAALEPELFVVAAFGQILPPSVLDIPLYGSINVHASLLPRWRGAAPIQAAILAGDTQTGVSIMLMDEGLDTGPVLRQESVIIRSTETGGDLSERLADLGANLLKTTIPDFIEGEITPQPQDERGATYAPMIKKADGRMDFIQPAVYLSRQVRAYEPWPTSYFFWKGTRIVVRSAYTVEPTKLKPGQTGLIDNLPAVGCSEGALVLDVLQPAGKRAMSGDAFLHGAQDFRSSAVDEPDGK